MSSEHFGSYGNLDSIITAVAEKINSKASKDDVTNLLSGNSAKKYIKTSSRCNTIYYSKTKMFFKETNLKFPFNVRGSNFFVDAEGNVYCVYNNGFLIWDKEAGIFKPKNFIGLTADYDFNPLYVWTYGGDTYYSYYRFGNNVQLVLNKETNTWENKTWNVNIDGSTVWSDGDDIYALQGLNYFSYSEVVLNKVTGEWENKTWTSMPASQANYISANRKRYIWTDGKDIYYSYNGNYHYVLNKENNSWDSKTWNSDNVDLSKLGGDNIWSDGDNIYCTYRTDIQAVLTKETNTWVNKDWGDTVILNNFDGGNHWTDGEDHYISGSGTYKYNKDTCGFELVVLYGEGQGYLQPDGFWTDGENVYYSSGDAHYVLNPITWKWEPKVWHIPSRQMFSGNNIWTDGDNIYHSLGSSQLVLDKETDTWENKTWNGFSNLQGNYIWSDVDNIYYSSGANQYVLNKETSTWTAKTWTWEGTAPSSPYGQAIWTDGDNIYYSQSSAYQFVLNKATSTWSTKTWNWSDAGSYVHGNMVFCYEDEIYLKLNSSSHSAYRLNKNNNTWEAIEYTGIDGYTWGGNTVWSDGLQLYSSLSEPGKTYFITFAKAFTKL